MTLLQTVQTALANAAAQAGLPTPTLDPGTQVGIQALDAYISAKIQAALQPPTS
jgi:hypothetical protein